MLWVIRPTFTGAKQLLQNLTTSKFAGDEEVIAFYGASMEAMWPVAQNRRKPPTECERETYKILKPEYSQILDHVWKNLS